MVSYFDATREQFQQFLQHPADKPLQMLNLLRFVELVPEKNISGEAQYKIYMKAILPFLKKAGGKVLYYGRVNMNLIGPMDAEVWHKVLIVEYANKEDFIQMVTDKTFPSDLRKLALADSRLIYCEPINS